uniref:Uncharacterized protein n=1 Tax=Astyanax mexicanus TaxID=7994 RepID=A0A3B1IDL8_ASTMX
MFVINVSTSQSYFIECDTETLMSFEIIFFIYLTFRHFIFLNRGRSGLVQDQSRCGVCEQLLVDPVSITCGHSFCRRCINSFWDRTALSGDFICPCCRKRSNTRPALHQHIVESIEQDSSYPVDDVLQRILQKHKTSMKNRYENGCDLTLDPNTVHRRLSLSEKNRMAVWREERQAYPDHPERFNKYQQVLSRESFTGRCYWEAEWSGREGAEVALSYKTISRKGDGPDCRFGGNINSWRLNCSDNEYSVHHNLNITKLRPPPFDCKRVGVYVDCPAGTLSFYSVSSDTQTLTHSHTFYTTFTQPLYAGFAVYDGSSVSVSTNSYTIAIPQHPH